MSCGKGCVWKTAQRWGRRWAFLVAQMVKNHLQCRRPEFDPWVRKIPEGREWLLTPIFLPRESHGGGAWQATVHGVTKSCT